ncbi:hypothetical protein ABSA28_00145 [Candidatus Hepatincolaceae symbiont of Richtersius coronifer]
MVQDLLSLRRPEVALGNPLQSISGEFLNKLGANHLSTIGNSKVLMEKLRPLIEILKKLSVAIDFTNNDYNVHTFGLVRLLSLISLNRLSLGYYLCKGEYQYYIMRIFIGSFILLAIKISLNFL